MFLGRASVSKNSIGIAIRRKVSFINNVLNKNLNYFPEINPTRLLTGKEKMLLEAEINKKAVKEVGLAYINQTLNEQVKTSILIFFSEDEEVRNALPAYIKKVIIKVK